MSNSKDSDDLGAIASEKGNSDPYLAMVEVTKASLRELLAPFHAASNGSGTISQMSTDEFFQQVLLHADKFTDICCQQFSKVLRQASVLPEVRGMPTVELAKQVRQVVFERLDKILVSYIEALRAINLNLQGVAEGLSGSSLLGEALKGAAIGQVAGGFGKPGKVVGALGALVAAGDEAMKQQMLREMQHRLRADGQGLAFSKIVEYLKEVSSLPEQLLDYGCARCFGSQLDFNKQITSIAEVNLAFREELTVSLLFTLRIQREETEAIERAQAAAAQRARALKEANWENDPTSAKFRVKFAKGIGIALIVIVSLLWLLLHFAAP